MGNKRNPVFRAQNCSWLVVAGEQVLLRRRHGGLSHELCSACVAAPSALLGQVPMPSWVGGGGQVHAHGPSAPLGSRPPGHRAPLFPRPAPPGLPVPACGVLGVRRNTAEKSRAAAALRRLNFSVSVCNPGAVVQAFMLKLSRGRDLQC